MEQYDAEELMQYIQERKFRLLRARLSEMNEADIAEFLGELAAQGAGGRCVCISGTGCAGTHY